MTDFQQFIKDLRNKAIELSFQEDSYLGDHTSTACIDENSTNAVSLKVKDKGIISGVEVARSVLLYSDPRIEIEVFIVDGSKVNFGDIVFKAYGPARSILKAERILLNLMQRMSGIATKTAEYVDKIKDTKAKLLDTRKTAPCLRYFDKEAVIHGGGHNHRYGLFDMIMIKDNHIDFAGGIEKAVAKTKEYLQRNNLNLAIEVETRSLDDVKRVLEIEGINRIMLDNFSIENTHKAVRLVNGFFEVESSGGITLENIREYALCGVDFISVGALTHNVKGLDLSLKAI